MLRRRLLTVLLALALPAVAAGTRAAPVAAAGEAPTVGRWIELELDAIARQRTNPPRAARALALVSVAMHRAAEAAARGNGEDTMAVAGAASTVLAYLFPDERSRIGGLVEPLTAGRSHPRERESPALTLGRRIGDEVVDRARSDGADALWRGSIPLGSGFWVPTPPAFADPLEPLAGTWRPWNLASGSQFRAGPPPAYGGTEFMHELREVYDVSRNLTAEQKAMATLWGDGAGTPTPAGHWNLIALDLLQRSDLSTVRQARMLAALNTAQADAFIACWDAKYAYWSVRPVSAIRALLDPTWSSYLVTPPFPSYVSGHSTTSAAAATVLAAYFPSAAATLEAMALEASLSRLYGGIHYRSDNVVGRRLGERVGRAALEHYPPA